jgi:predicted nucleic acid-binding protein
MIDTSVLVAGLTQDHEFHSLARPLVVAAAQAHVPGIVLAEAWAVLRRTPWNLDAAAVQRALSPWTAEERIIQTPASAYVAALRRGRSLNLGGNVHDLLIAYTCASAGLPLTTLDRRQAALARTVPSLAVNLLLPDDTVSSA